MTWLAPWGLMVGALGVLGVLAAHLLSRQRPRALALATARFLPAGMLEATTLQTTPMDRWWMLLRMLIVALLALGVAQPVVTGTRVPLRTVLLLDRTLPADVQTATISALLPTDVLIAFDSTATVWDAAAAGAVTTATAPASLSAALGALVRVRDSLANRSTALRIAVASRFSPRSIDPVTAELRRLIPDSVVVVPVVVPQDSVIARAALTVLATGDDPIAATAALLGDSIAPAGARLQRGAALTGDDSLAARRGATVVWWPARESGGSPVLQGITVGDVTWVAALGRDSAARAAPAAAPVGWWADGAPAVWKTVVGRGCVLELDAALPAVGDQTLSLSAQAWLGALVRSCDRDDSGAAAPPEWLAPRPTGVGSSVARASISSAMAPWLLGSALALALLELLLRRRRPA
ncbi:MAG: BatA domain-containing protein [Gemmatimonadaceae bacterium]|nr:BatA domain-containing protein [Gemmatimonadaceae bacterium]